MPINPVAAGTTANPMAAGASATAASPLGGFEALLAALFGEGQAVSPLAKPGQAAGGEAPADGADVDSETAVSPDPTAQTLLAAAFVTTIPVAQTSAPSGQGQAAAGAAAPPTQTFAPPTLAAPTGAAPSDAAQTDAAQPAAPDAGFAAALPAGASAAETKATTPGAAPTAPAPTAAAPAPIEGAPLPQELLTGLAPKAGQGAEAAPAPIATGAAAPASPPAQQVAAATGAAAAAPLPDPDAPQPDATGEGDGEVAPKTAATGGVNGAAGQTPAAGSPGLPKLERADVAPQPPAPQADLAPQPTHGPASAEAAPAGAATSAHAPVHTAGVRGAPETVATLAAEILKKLDSRTTRFDMELEPAGLGKVDVRLEIGAHGRLTAAMAFDNPQSAQELRNRSGELARALEQAGFDVSDGLSFDVADNSGGSGQNNGAQEQTRDAPWRGRAFLSALETAGAADAPPPSAVTLSRTRASGVDIKI